MKLTKHFKGHYNFIVLDNKGETFDRYTIILSNGDVLGASDSPFSPMGFGQHCGNIADNYMVASYGYSWRKHCRVRACINDSIRFYLNDCAHVGQEIKFDDLPDEVKQFIKQNSKY